MPIPIKRLFGISAAIELGGYGVDQAPTPAANAVRMEDALWPKLIPDYVWKNRRGDAATGTMLELAPAGARGRHVALDIAWAIRGITGPYSGVLANEFDPVLQCCGHVGAYSAAPTPQWTYAITGVVRPSSTIYCYTTGQLWKVLGCRGRLTITWRPGQIAIARAQVNGLLPVDPLDVALPAFTWNTIVPPPAVSTALSVGPYVPDWLELEYDGGNPIERLESGNAADGIQSFDFGTCSPTIKLIGKTVAIATYSPFIADMKIPTPRVFVATLGSVQYNKLTINEPAAAVLDVKNQDQSHFAGWQVDYLCSAPSLLFN